MKTINTRMKMMLAGTLLTLGFGGALVGCVEDEASLSLTGSVIYEGEVLEGPPARLQCDIASAQPGSVDLYFHTADLNLADEMPLVFNAELLNLLEQSNQETGTQTTFPGMYQDQNKIRLTRAKIEYPSDLNNFPGGGLADQFLGRPEVRVGALLDSAGGGVITQLHLYEPGTGIDRQRFVEFYDEVMVRAGHPGDTRDAIVPLVARIKFEGKTIGGDEVESNSFEFPIRLCRDCQIDTTPPCLAKK